jgi:hypothetical protein
MLDLKIIATENISMSEAAIVKNRNGDEWHTRCSGGEIGSHSQLRNVKRSIDDHTLIPYVLIIRKHSLLWKGVGDELQIQAFVSNPAIQERSRPAIFSARDGEIGWHKSTISTSALTTPNP